ncbi:stress-induced-phosphoprotein 1-like isoform X2 [Macrobrachium nipponense]|uniref:stress-induced-phosphoprotein 1-like isoform X2 n=1 Tax=Macrobrachium nipponense TaxID=159736 RepID=UPI0030C88DD3
MGISEKDAFRILELPLGVDKDAIKERYKKLSLKLSSSKCPDDKKKLEQVVAAYSQLIPLPPPKAQPSKNNKSSNSKSQPLPVYDDDDDDSEDGSSEDEWRVYCRNGDARNNISKVNQDLTGAEKEKRKAEKRRAKKKRRKEKKKIEKIENQIITQNSNSDKRNCDSDSEEGDDEEEEESQGLDPNSAFVAMAASKKIGTRGAVSKPEEKRKNLSKNGSQEEEDGLNSGLDTLVLQSRQLAIRGNEAANVGQYTVAVRLFTEAIRLDPNDHRFFGNRSYCYDQLGQHEKALKDAEKAIRIAPQWPKGHYRRGTSLRGLGKYIDAESAFEEVLRLDKGCQEAQEEIRKVRIVRLVEMGFTERQANSAIRKYTNVQPALDALLAGEFKETLDDVFYSDEEDDFVKRVKVPQTSKDVKMNPKNPEGLTSLWVGNVLPEVTEKMLSQLFSKKGHVTSVRLLKEKYCAFVNYADKEAAGRAMETLQGHDLCGQKLLIKFPDNPIVNGTQNVIFRKTKPPVVRSNTKPNGVASGIAVSPPATQVQNTAQSQSNGSKLKGPVNGDECYFWRTTGCVFGDSCKHKHIPNHKGIDKKPWQK